jgi:DNA-directed RNA polymerase subunit RPC12/RpoP
MEKEKTVLGLKCKNCGADLKFSPKYQMWICEFCGSQYDKEEFDSNKEKTSKKDASVELDEYSCPNCGAIVVADKNTSATECVYCGSSAIIKNRLQGRFKPDKIITFKTEKSEAVSKFQKYVSERWFAPDEFGKIENIEKVSGIYIPFWLFDCKTRGIVNAECSNSRIYISGNYRVTETDVFQCGRAGTMDFLDVPVDGSTKFPDDVMDSIEPYDYSEFKEFNYSYLSGFLAEKYDLDSTEVYERAKVRVENTTLDKVSESLHKFQQVNILSTDVNVENGEVEYALLPVWMLNINYLGNRYTFAMNGQTGKMVGNVPIKKSKVFKFGIKLFASLFVFLFILALIFGII